MWSFATAGNRKLIHGYKAALCTIFQLFCVFGNVHDKRLKWKIKKTSHRPKVGIRLKVSKLNYLTLISDCLTTSQLFQSYLQVLSRTPILVIRIHSCPYIGKITIGRGESEVKFSGKRRRKQCCYLKNPPHAEVSLAWQLSCVLSLTYYTCLFLLLLVNPQVLQSFQVP